MFKMREFFTMQSPVGIQSTRRCYLQLNRFEFKRYYSDLSHLKEEMISRRLPWVGDILTPVSSKLLRKTLVGFLPTAATPSPRYLPPGFHLIHFPTQSYLSSLLPDGTEPTQSPGVPYSRRMWAGGSINFYKSIRLNSSAFRCLERITDVQVKGQGIEQKIFVKIERSIYNGMHPDEDRMVRISFPKMLWETRTLVFMHQRASADATSPPGGKILKPTMTPDFSHTLVPTPALLFRFSALTFNAHAIHLDKQYCRDVEGHRNLLVHGPLSLVLLLEFLGIHLHKPDNKHRTRKELITSVEYRNLAPLYAEEEMKLCIKRKVKSRIFGSWDVWIEGRDGGYAVKGVVETVLRSVNKRLTGIENVIATNISQGASAGGSGSVKHLVEQAALAPKTEGTSLGEIPTIPDSAPVPESKNRPKKATTS